MPKQKSNVSPRTRVIGFIGLIIIGFIMFLNTSLHVGGHMMGPTHIDPGNVGLVIDNYHGTVQKDLMPAGTHWQGLWETVIEIPTSQRTISLTHNDPTPDGNGNNAVQVNTVSNLLTVDVSAQYQIDSNRASDLYNTYQDRFGDIRRFELENLEPSVKGAINYAIGDMDTATALTTVGKVKAEQAAKDTLNEEWEPRGIVFSNIMIRGIEQDQASKDLLATTNSKLQDIENAKLGLQQQKFDNQTILQQATSEATVNRLRNSTLTDIYVQDQLLSRVKKIYLPSDELMGILK